MDMPLKCPGCNKIGMVKVWYTYKNRSVLRRTFVPGRVETLAETQCRSCHTKFTMCCRSECPEDCDLRVQCLSIENIVHINNIKPETEFEFKLIM